MLSISELSEGKPRCQSQIFPSIVGQNRFGVDVQILTQWKKSSAALFCVSQKENRQTHHLPVSMFHP
jgi:hypothetical protein